MLRFDAGHPGYREFGRLDAEVAPGDTLDIELRLRPGGPLEDCRVDPQCSVLVSPAPSGLAEDEAFRLLAYGTVIALDWTNIGTNRWYACVLEESRAVLVALEERYRPVVPDTECELPLAEMRGSAKLRHAQTGAPAFRAQIERTSPLSPDRRTVFLTRYVGPRSAAFWRCEFERVAMGWQPTVCVLERNAQ
jgi:hypothetical protein